MWFAWLTSAVATAACPTTIDLTAFRAETEKAWAAMRDGRREAGRAARLRLQGALRCVADPLTPADAAAFHRLRAIEAVFAGDERGARAAAWAAWRLAPGATRAAGEQIADFGPLVASDPPPPVADAFGTSLAATVVVDGSERPVRIVGQPTIVQVFDTDGAPIDGAWVDGRDRLPDWVAFPRVACPEPVAVGTLLEQSDNAERAYAELDVTAFVTSLRAVAAGLPCITGAIATPQAAAIHRLEGLRLYTVGAEISALRSFQQAQALDPLFVPPETILRPESALARLWERAQTATPSPWIATPAPRNVELVVDGMGGRMRPASLPSIVQVSTPSGEVLWTRYVPAGAGLPDLTSLGREAAARAAAQVPPAERLYLDAAARRRRRNQRASLIIGSTLSLSTSALFYARNVQLVSEFNDPITRNDRRPELRRQANQAATLSSAFFIGSVGLLGAAVVLP